MNYIFKSIFALMTLTALSITQGHTRDMIVITYHAKEERAQLVEQILLDEVGIPANLISLRRQSRPCHKRAQPIVQICIDENEQMHFVVFNEEVVLNSFRIFLENKE